MFRSIAAVALLCLAAAAAEAQTQDKRGVDVQTLTVAARYRYVQDSADRETANQLQDQVAVKGRWTLDPKGRLSINAGAFTGTSISSSWNNTGLGTGEHMLLVRVKQLYLAVAPAKGVDAEVGSLYFVRGESTEITSYDNDAYLTGERVSVKRPRDLFFDEITLTHAFLGDTSKPNVFRRLDGLGRSNYKQVLIGKKLGPSVSASADWTDTLDGTAWRGAVRVKLPAVVDAVRAEYYARTDVDGSGGALTLERQLPGGISASGGYATIDRRNSTLNGDRYGRGRRFFGGATVPVVGPLSASVFYTHLVDTPYAVPIGQRLDIVATYNVLAAFQQPKP